MGALAFRQVRRELRPLPRSSYHTSMSASILLRLVLTGAALLFAGGVWLAITGPFVPALLAFVASALSALGWWMARRQLRHLAKRSQVADS